jgi:hypothetical protein
MKTATFVCPFDQETRQTILPVDENGQPIPMDMWHKTRESGKTIVVEVRGEDEVIDSMKAAGSGYGWLEVKEEPVVGVPVIPPEETIPEGTKPVDEEPMEEEEIQVDPGPVLTKADPVELKSWLISEATSFSEEAVENEKWDSQDDAIESVVKLHGQTMDAYRSGGLG